MTICAVSTGRQLPHPLGVSRRGSERWFRLAMGMLLALVIGHLGLVNAGRLSGQETADQAAAGQAVGAGDDAAANTVYNDAARLQNGGAFKPAVEEWNKFLKQYPKHPKAALAKHYLGGCLVSLERYDEAAQLLGQLAQDEPKFELLDELLLNLGWSRYSLARKGMAEQYALAAEAFGQLYAKFPTGKYADEALFFQGESLFAADKKAEAAAAYRKLVDDFGESKRRCEALYALGVAYEETEKYVEAGEVYATFLKDCPDSRLVPEVQLRQAETLVQRGQIAEAAPQFAKLAAQERFALADVAQNRWAYCLAREKKYAEAAAQYVALVETFPSSTLRGEATLAAGRNYALAQQDEPALTWLKKALEGVPGAAGEAAHRICRIYLRGNRPAEAQQLAETTLPKADQSPYRVHLQMDLADARFEQPEQKAATVEAYAKIAVDNPLHPLAPQALYNAAFAALETKQLDRGLELAALFLDRFGDDPLLPDVKYVAAEAHLLQGRQAEAEKIYRDLVLNYPDHVEAASWQLRLATILLLESKHQELIDFLMPRLARLKDGRQAEANYLLGVAQYQLGRFPEAAQRLEAAVASPATWSKLPEALLYLGRTQAAVQQPAQAIATLKQLIDKHPASSVLDQAWYRLGEIQYGNGDFADAVASYGHVPQGWPKSTYTPYAHYGQGWSYMKSANAEQAAASFSRLLEAFPEHQLTASTHLARGMAYRQSAAYDRAIADLNQFLASDPKPDARADALLERGLCEVAQKNFPQAVTTFQEILKAAPEYPNADNVLYELAWTHNQAGDDAQALAAFQTLIDKYPRSRFAPDANFRLGEALYKSNEYAKAVEAYQRAAAAKPAGDLGENVLHMLGWSYYQLKNYAEALATFQSQRATHPAGKLAPDGQFMEGECQFKLEKYQDALATLTAALKQPLSSEDFQVLASLHAGQSAAQLDDWAQSLQLLDPIPEKYPQSAWLDEVYFERGRARQKTTQAKTREGLAPALEDFERAATRSRGPVGARARFMMGEVEFQLKAFEAAIGHFERTMYNYGGKEPEPDVRKWQANAAYEAGRCVEVQIADAPAAQKFKLIDRANKFFSQVAELDPQSPFAKLATQRIAELNKLR